MLNIGSAVGGNEEGQLCGAWAGSVLGVLELEFELEESRNWERQRRI